MFVTPNFFKRISAFLNKNRDLTKQTSIDTAKDVSPSKDGRIPGFKIISKKDGSCSKELSTIQLKN